MHLSLVAQEAKTKVLLDLEMRDYELTVEELNGQLAEKKQHITSLESEVERERGRCGSLQVQLTHLTTQEATERERAEKMKVSIEEEIYFVSVLHIVCEMISAYYGA